MPAPAETSCPRCGAPRTASDSSTGVCPRCLIGVGLDESLADGAQTPEPGTGTSPFHLDAPAEIGPYRLLKPLGEGGMGVVYLAEQTEPIRRRVALKLIKLGMDTTRVIARFDLERQTLALMRHPNIAGVLDAGVTRDGRPYFVMELVDGVPITDYCDTNCVDLRGRLDLFLQACDAIQHAHQKGMIHRDVKPSNLLVTEEDGRPMVKAIDFGIARAIGSHARGATLSTGRDVLLGTPEFMSPEQAGGTDREVDTRTDVYALGAVLYQLLAGVLPFDRGGLRGLDLAEIRRRIQEEDPPSPGSRLAALEEEATSIATARGSTPSVLRRALRGDLDWIVMKALEREPSRRYGSPRELAADILRHLEGRPLLAGPPSLGYRLGKFVRRHRAGAAAVAALAVFLVVLAVMQAAQARRLARERDRANRESEAASAVSRFLVDLFELSSPEKARGETIPAREILDRGAARIENDLADQPELQARLMGTVGSVYKKMGLFADAEPLLQRSGDLNARLLGEDHPDTIGSLLQMADLRFSQGKLAEAEEALRDAATRGRRGLGESHPDTLSALADLAVILHFQGRMDEAEAQYREALALRTAHLGADAPGTLETVNNLATLYYASGRLTEAEPLLRRALEGRRRNLGHDHPESLDSLINLAVILQTLARLEEAEAYSREAVEIGRRIRPDHPKTLVSLNNLASILESRDKLPEAEEAYRKALDTLRRTVGEEHADTLTTAGNLGDLYLNMGRLEEAGDLLVPMMEAVRRTQPPVHLVTGYSLRKYGRWLAHSGRLDEALPVLTEAERVLTLVAGPDHLHTRRAREALAELEGLRRP